MSRMAADRAGRLAVHHPGGRAPHLRLGARASLAGRAPPVVTQAVAAAAAQGDRSENANTPTGKRRLRGNRPPGTLPAPAARGHGSRRPAPRRPGARVLRWRGLLLESEDGAQSRYRIVGPDEFDRAPGYISMDSPLGRAFLAQTLDDEVSVEAPGGKPARS